MGTTILRVSKCEPASASLRVSLVQVCESRVNASQNSYPMSLVHRPTIIWFFT